MSKLLAYYETELQRLKDSAGAFAELYPAIAGRLMLGSDDAQDPHVERLIQSFALLAARVHKRIDDDLPLITESLLNSLYPHYLRPFPSCSIAQFEPDETKVTHYPRETALLTHPIAGQGIACEFRSSCDVTTAPMAVSALQYRHAAKIPSAKASSTTHPLLSLELQLLNKDLTWLKALPQRKLRVYLNAEPSQVSALRQVLCHHVHAIRMQTAANEPWSGPNPERIEQVGFARDEALLDYDERSHPAYRLLTEYFAFPEKFNFLDIPIAASALKTSSRTITLHLVLFDIPADGDLARALTSVSHSAFMLGCTPVVNLFETSANPIAITHTSTQYPVVVNPNNAASYEVYSIDQVFRTQEEAQGNAVDEFKPFFSLRHPDLLGRNQLPSSKKKLGQYWHAHRDEDLSLLSPGYEMQLAVVDARFEPTHPQTQSLSVRVTATNRHVPSTLLSFKNRQGDLFLKGKAAKKISLIKKPTPTHRFDHGQGRLWRLISHLSLNHLSLSGQGVQSLKEMLRLYDLPASPSNQMQIEALIDVAFEPTTAWLKGKPFATFVRGTLIKLFVNEDSFVGTGLSLFVAVLDHFFGLYAQLNSFTQLQVISHHNQQVLLLCPPRSGSQALV
jgi:type VI secretion system protein ImpG